MISASAAASCRPRLSPWPAIGWITWAASPSSASRSADEAARDAERERIGLRLRLEGEPPEFQPEAALELHQEIVGIGTSKAGTFSLRSRPDDGGAVCRAVGRLGLQRQDREGAGGQEMLDRPALVVPLMGDRGHDAGLPVGPGDPADAGLLAQPRARAIGGHEQRRRQRLAAGERHVDAAPALRKP